MGTKEQTVSAASTAAAAAMSAAEGKNVINGFDDSLNGVTENTRNDTHISDSCSNKSNVATHSSNTNTLTTAKMPPSAKTTEEAEVKVDLAIITKTKEKLHTGTVATSNVSSTSTSSSHHSKAQVIIIPATPASTVATNAAKKIRRAFSMPRNPFQWSRKFKTNGNSGSGAEIIGGEPGETSGGRGSNSALTACVGGGRGGRSGSIVSLNSYTAVCRDEGGVGDSVTPDGTKIQSQRQDKKNGTNIGRQQSTGVAGGGGSDGNNTENASSGGIGSSASNTNRVFRRSSLRKFINRIAQHVSTSVNIGSADKSAFVGIVPFYTGCWRRKEANKHASSQANSLSSSDRVPPIGVYQWPADQTPGVTGLKNHGNTCFMNAVLQCLSHTDILAEYFVLDQYKVDLKRRNKINSRKFGTKGELTEQLANVLKALWTCKNENDHSTSFKAVVDRYGSQFRSSTQHDAQEFLFWLLDKVHEDLNTATKRRYKSVKNNYGRSDEIIAAETLANHIRCNNSFVQAVFQAQFRSSLTCPRCKKQSNTFDPFHCISVQLPQLQQQTIFVTVLYLKQHPQQVKLGLTVPAGSPIVALREQLHTDTGIASDRMVLVDINETGFTRVFYDTQPVSTLLGIETIYCIEVPENQKKDETKKSIDTAASTLSNSNAAASATTITASTTNSSSSTNTTDLLLLIANVKKKKKTSAATDGTGANEIENSTERFGIPFCLRAPRDCSYVELQKKILREMSVILKPEVFSYATPLSEMFQIRLQDPSADPDTYLEQVEHPLLTEMIDLALSVLSAEAGPAHIKLLLEWSEPEAYFADLSNTVVEHESVARLLERKYNDTAALTLEQCLEHYTKAETLSAEDAWRCPHCQQYLPVVKTLGLWSLPDILVVHFKRFRQHQAKGPNAAKLTTMVKFPLNAFDMSPHLAKGMRDDGAGKETFVQNQQAESFPGPGPNARPSPWKKSRTGDSRSSTLNSNKENRETRYDLYAVCYHQGDTLETGHYTAACKNPYDHQWYKFDDQRVSKVPSDSIEEDIINNEAYMLFYQRRKTDIAECSGSSSTSGEHWVSKIAPPLSVSAIVAKNTTVGETELAITSNIPEAPPEKAETKPLEIPKVEGVKRKEEDIAENVSKLPKPDTPLTQMVVIDKKHLDKNVNIEGIEFADDGAEDVDELDILEQLTPTITGSPTNDDVNQIFVMDEDCKLNSIHYNDKDHNNENCKLSLPTTTEMTKFVVTTNAVQSNNTPTKSKSPTLLTVSGVIDKSEKRKPSPVPQIATNGFSSNHISPNQNQNGKVSPQNSSVSSSTSSLSSRSSPHSLAVSTYGASTLQSKFNGFAASSSSANNYQKETVLLSSSLKSNSSSIIAAAAAAHSNDFLHNRHHYQQQHWHGSRSSVSAVESATSSTHHPQHHTHCLNLRHSFSTSSNYKLKECSDTLSSMLRNSANTCSKDTLIFIDQQQHHHHHHHHSLIEDDDDTFMDSRSLWISPVTPHKLITVSPKN